ncbi:unnamed protein product, partial [Rotaria sp. Silwood2]
KFQALIQSKDPIGAAQAKLLQIEYSKLHSLTVKFNNDKSRDYTNPTLPSGEGTISQQQELGM